MALFVGSYTFQSYGGLPFPTLHDSSCIIIETPQKKGKFNGLLNQVTLRKRHELVEYFSEI